MYFLKAEDGRLGESACRVRIDWGESLGNMTQNWDLSILTFKPEIVEMMGNNFRRSFQVDQIGGGESKIIAITKRESMERAKMRIY